AGNYEELASTRGPAGETACPTSWVAGYGACGMSQVGQAVSPAGPRVERICHSPTCAAYRFSPYMTVAEVFAGVALRTQLPPDLALSRITGIEYDSRRIAAGNLFFAFEGQHADGRRFAADAMSRGAAAVVSQSPK